MGSFIGRTANLVDFFIPLIPLGPTRDEDLQGIFRLSRPALGKTGIVRLAAGRPEHPNLYGLATFYPNNAPDIGADEFCRYLDSNPSETLNQPSETDMTKMRAAIFSFDASKVYDTWVPPVGAHDDVRDRGVKTSCPASAFKKEKREHSFDFVYLFTKGRLDKELLKTLPKESK